MENNFDDKMHALGYNHLVCNIFSEWEDVKDELLPTDRKSGSGNGTIHVFLGHADSELRKEFGDYYNAVEAGEDPSVKAVEVKHFFSVSNVFSMIGFVCKYYADKGEDFAAEVSSILSAMSEHEGEETLATTSFFKLSIGSNRLRPYFKQFDSKGVFCKIIRCLLLPNSAYKISLYRSDDGHYAAYWLIGSEGLSDFEADANRKKLKTEVSSQPPKINRSLQQIFYGAPGTGKSHTIKEETKDLEKAGRVIRTTFHPDSDYSTFVGAYKPTMEYMPVRNSSGLLVKTNGSTTAVDDGRKDLVRERQITYNFVPQAFLQAYVAAWTDRTTPEYLVIEEINRGNCAQIFGDLFQLLDRGNDGYSEYPIKADKDLEEFLKEAFADVKIEDYPNVQSGEELLLPDNLFIRATMNTSDQSLFPIDSAFKRRWDWQYVPIHNVPSEGYKIQVDDEIYDWWQFLAEINKRIRETASSEDKQLGYFFCKAKDGVISAETFVSKVVFYIWNDVFKDYEFRNDAFKDGKDENGKERKLEFKDFYSVDSDGNTIVVTTKIRKFLDNLELKPIVEYDPEDNDGEEETHEPTLRPTRDRSRYSINGEGKYKKRNIAEQVMLRYVADNPDLGVAEILEQWKNFDNVFSNIAVSKEYFENFVRRSTDPMAATRFIEVEVRDEGVIYVSNQWEFRHLKPFSEKLAELGWPYTIARVEK